MAQKVVIILSGKKQSGKDTFYKVAKSYIEDNYPNITLTKFAYAEPLKEICRKIYDLSDDQINGNLKEVPDERYPVRDDILARKLGMFADGSGINGTSDPAQFQGCNPIYQLGYTPGDTVSSKDWILPPKDGVYGYLTPRLIMQKIGTEVCRSVYNDTWVLSAWRDKVVPWLQLESNHMSIIVCTDARFANEITLMQKLVSDYADIKIRTIKILRETSSAGSDQHISEQDINEFQFDVTISNNSDLSQYEDDIRFIISSIIKEIGDF